MHFFIPCIAATVLLFCSPPVTAEEKAGSHHDCAREKRDAGLFPFPRVGRTFPLTWSFVPFKIPEQQNAKREQLIPFPRIGKSGPKRNGASGGGGLWFGPRLGRLSKRMEVVPVSFRQEADVPENLIKSVLKDPAMKSIGNQNDVEDYLDAKQ